MRQYAICRLKDGRLGPGPDYVVVLQRDWLSDVRTRIVAPLNPLGQVMAAERLHPRLDIEGKAYVVMMDRLAATDGKLLIETNYSAEAIRDEITRAIDMLFTG
ncbi:MAG: CcdB family protein [Beijerinckiaceae bacterium]